MSNPRWSYSRFSTFQSCKNKYKLQYIDELLVIGKEIELADKGLSVHQIMEQMNSNIVYDELIKIAEKDLENREFDKEKFPILKAIPRLFEWWQEFITPFENQGFELLKESWERGYISGMPVVGALDSLLFNKDTNEVRIYDFKTGKKASASSYKNQLLLYAYLIGTRLKIENISEKIKLFIFFPLADLSDEESLDKELAKKQALKNMKQIVFSNDDITNVVSEFENIIKEDSRTLWKRQDPVELAQLSYSCSWCGFAGSKQYCPASYEVGCRFPRKAQIISKEEYEKTKNSTT